MSATPSLILGTAGHIDHGKSSLIQALTGEDPDRLVEEKRRGITIELGFAQLELPSGRTLGVVDVPGHERFVRQMVAGATGVDLALLVIAADDGVMPQTVEHLAILTLLGVKSCVVALTKIDLVDDEWRSFVADEVTTRLAETPFAGAPIVGVSSRTGAGLDELRSALDTAAAHAEHTKDEGSLRLPIDRVFSVKGFGTVVTGTLWSGQASVGDAVEVLPSGAQTRIRSVQIHGHDSEVAAAGNRVAVSLNALSTSEVRPGDFLAAPGTIQPSDRFDARFYFVDPLGSGKPLESGVRVHVAHGTREVLGRVLFMNGTATLAPGENAWAQIRLDEPLPLTYRDRFIVRSYSPVRVIGGGMVLAAHPRRRTTVSESELALLGALEANDTQGAVDAYISLTNTPFTCEDVARGTGLTQEATHAALAAVLNRNEAVALGTSVYMVRKAVLQRLLSTLDRALLTFHTEQPNATGIGKEALRQRVAPTMDPACFDEVLAEAEARGAVARLGGEVSHPHASAGARERERQAAETLATLLEAANDAPPELDDLAAQASVDVAVACKALAALEREGRVVRLGTTRYYAASTIDRYRSAIMTYLQQSGSASAADLKDAMGISRKFAMPLLEYFDSTGFTRREGDVRVLVK